LYQADVKASGDHIENTLFYCLGGPNGDIIVDKVCDTCMDNGTGRNDFCSSTSPFIRSDRRWYVETRAENVQY
jgi:hypothetical protein